MGGEMKNHVTGGILGLAGLMICHVLGAFHYSIIAQMDFIPSFLLVSVPYLPKDILSVAGAMVVSIILKKTLAKGGISLTSHTV